MARKDSVFCLCVIRVCGMILIYAVLFIFLYLLYFNNNNNIMEFLFITKFTGTILHNIILLIIQIDHNYLLLTYIVYILDNKNSFLQGIPHNNIMFIVYIL